MEKFVGIWKCEKSENFGKYLEAIGAPKQLFETGDETAPTLRISQRSKNNLRVQIENGHPTYFDREVDFILGEAFDEVTSDGRKNIKTVVNLQDGKLVYLQKWDGKETTAVRDIVDGKLVVKLTYGDIVSVRRYSKA